MANSNVTGLEELQRNMQTFAKNMATKVMPGAIDAGLIDMEQRAKAAAPVNTGELRDSIHAIPAIAEADVTVGALVVGAEHAALVEFGTVHMSPQPYLRPAIDETNLKPVGEFAASNFEKAAP